jgi:hypothetical protein
MASSTADLADVNDASVTFGIEPEKAAVRIDTTMSPRKIQFTKGIERQAREKASFLTP